MMMECGIWHRMNEIKTVTYAKKNKNKEKVNLFSHKFTYQRINPVTGSGKYHLTRSCLVQA